VEWQTVFHLDALTLTNQNVRQRYDSGFLAFCLLLLQRISPPARSTCPHSNLTSLTGTDTTIIQKRNQRSQMHRQLPEQTAFASFALSHDKSLAEAS
jgi:hypothetical protein